MMTREQLLADAIAWQRVSASEYRTARQYRNDAKRWQFMPVQHTRTQLWYQNQASEDAAMARDSLFAILDTVTYTQYLALCAAADRET